ncbi:MAG: hypothetical protein ACE5JJ_06110 [Nitrospinota bacterium]
MTARPARKKAKAAARVPGEVRAFAEERGLLRAVEEAPSKAREIFPGFVDLSVSVDHDPEVEGWDYIRFDVQLDCGVEEALDAKRRFNRWLREVIPPGSFLLVGVVLSFVDDGSP